MLNLRKNGAKHIVAQNVSQRAHYESIPDIAQLVGVMPARLSVKCLAV